MKKKDKKNNSGTVNIRPSPGFFSVLSHLNYRPWYALAEFVDNAIQSFFDNKDTLKELYGPSCKVVVRIDIEAAGLGRISIKDNAGGIAQSDFPRAFRPAEVPVDATGLSEFGMGMKSAACWFSPKWHVRTKAIGENVERIVSVDVKQIVKNNLEELSIIDNPADRQHHFTEVVLEDLNQNRLPVKRTLGKIREHLTDIYREYVRNEILELYLNGEELQYQEPNVLNVPYFAEENGKPRVWRKCIDFDFGQGLSAKGFAALRDRGSTAKSGFALFRRGRLIQGSGDEGYRPKAIFVQPNSFRSQRLFGELHLEGFEVSHTKDGFRWDENEEPFLDLLKEKLDSDKLPLLSQADGYRVRGSRKELVNAVEQALEGTANAIKKGMANALANIADEPTIEIPSAPLKKQDMLREREFTIDFLEEKWTIKVELVEDPAESDWLKISNQPADKGSNDVIEIRVMLSHKFMLNFAQTDPENLEAILRIAAGLAFAEKMARMAGIKDAGTVIRNLNDVLSDSLSDLSIKNAKK